MKLFVWFAYGILLTLTLMAINPDPQLSAVTAMIIIIFSLLLGLMDYIGTSLLKKS